MNKYKTKNKNNFDNLSDKTNNLYEENIFHTFNPFDKLIIFPIINLLKPFIKFIGYKSNVVGSISIISYICAFYFIYYKNKLLVWFFTFLGTYSRFLDKLFTLKQDKKIKSINPYYINELIIKIVIYIVIFALLEGPPFNNVTEKHNYVYFIIFLITMLIITKHNCKKINPNIIT
jgi:hypothetical protein